MKILADMAISQSTVSFLRGLGYNAIHLREQGLQKISDKEIIEKAYKENRIILTFDLDFSTLMAASKNANPSIIIFRLKNAKPDNLNARLLQVLEKSSYALEKGAIISVEETNHRTRLLPIG